MSFQFLKGAAIAGLQAESSEEVLRALSHKLFEIGAVTPSFGAAILEREKNFPTGLPTETPTAIPHTDPQHVKISGLAIASLAQPVEFREMGNSENPLQIQLVIMMLLKEAHSQLEGLQLLVGKLQDQAGIQRLLEAKTDTELYELANHWIAS